MTANEIIKAALRKIGYAGETPSAQEMIDGLESLQALLGTMSTKNLMIESTTIDSFSLISGQAAYTVGASGSPDVSDTRPEIIGGAYVRIGSSDYIIDIISEESYRILSRKSTSGRPHKLWYNATIPNGTINLYPTPGSTDTLYYSHQQPLAEPSKLTSSVVVARNYDMPLIWILAENMAPEYGKEPSPFLQRMAVKAMSDITAANAAKRVAPVWVDIMQTPNSRTTIYEG